MSKSGWEHLCGRRYQEAIQHFSKAIELDPTFAEAYSNRAIAKRILGVDGAEDEAMADDLTMHDEEALEKLRQERKWMCIGFDARGEPEGETVATNADFLISFASPDSHKNNQILEELKSGVNYCEEVRPLPVIPAGFWKFKRFSCRFLLEVRVPTQSKSISLPCFSVRNGFQRIDLLVGPL